jgi:sulfate adenylyltransferase subunit 1
MITGASNASVSLILVDARKGVIEQTTRHFYIASLLRIKQVIVCINKMDLVDYDQQRFEEIKSGFEKLVEKAGFEGQSVKFIPVAAKQGDNIVFSSIHMPWYTNETLLEVLENIPATDNDKNIPARFPVQFVIRPHLEEFHDFRGYAGKLNSGELSKGDEVVVLPSLKTTRIREIKCYEQSKENFKANESVVITLEDDIDVSRGNMIVRKSEQLLQTTELTATICWMDEQPGSAGKFYWLQHGPNRVKSKITNINTVLDILSLNNSIEKKSLGLNDIGEVNVKLARPVFADKFTDNPANGSFILIDEYTNNTVAVGFIR